MILSPSLVFLPIPLSGVVPAMVIGLIALAYLEEDALLLPIGLMAAVVVGDGRVCGNLGHRPWRKTDRWLAIRVRPKSQHQ
jgi:Exopolysaccharide synthesis, ExoD